MLVSVFTFFLTALQRYLTIVFNKGKLWLFSTKWLPLVLPVTWTLCFCLAIPMTYPGIYIVATWRDFCSVTSDELLLRMRIINSVAMLLPLALVLVFYVHMYWVVRKASARVQQHGAGGGRSVSSHHSHMAKVLFVLYVFAAAVYIPFILFFFVTSRLSPDAVSSFYVVSFIFLILVSTCNPVLYAVLFKPVKQQYMRMLGKTTDETNMVTNMTQSINQ